MVGTRTSSTNANALNLSEDGNRIVSAITLQIDDLRNEMRDMRKEFADSLTRKTAEINHLKNEANIFKARLEKMEEKLGDTEAKMRQNNVIFSGEDIPVSIARENCSQVIRDVLATKINLIIPTADIDVAYRVGKPRLNSANNQSENAKRTPILVKFKNSDIKRNIYTTCKTVKPNFFVNDDLTPVKQTILYVLRQTKKKHPNIVNGCSSSDGHVCAWVKPQSSSEGVHNRRVMVNTVEKLRNFCTNILKAELDSFISVWPH